MRDVTPFVINERASLRSALSRLNETAEGILLLVDEAGRLRRTITDGDLRRLLLEGHSLESSLSVLDALEPKVIGAAGSEADVLAIMDKFAIDHVPAVDSARVPVGLWLRREISRQILLSTPHLSDYERGYVEEAFSSNWVAPLGPNVDAFEQELTAHVGSKSGAALSSGTAAIHLALCVLGVEAGDVVFCSTLTFVASVNPVLYQGATPVFIDSEPESWNMSPQALRRALHDAAAANRLPKAVIVVNLYGQSADYDPIRAECDRYGVPIIEDAAESLGATYKGRASGTIGVIGTYSFNGNKIITTSGGGMLVSDNEDYVTAARFLATQARDPFPYYHHTKIGYNYRMSNILAGIGRGQLKVLDDRVAARRHVYHYYREQLADAAALQWMPEAPFGRSTHWLTACTIDAAADVSATDLIGVLAGARIEARRLWKPMHSQPLFAGCRYYPHEDGVSVSDDLFERGVCLPSGSNMSKEELDRIVAVIDSALSRRLISAAKPLAP